MLLDACLLISLAIICRLFIDMVENADDDPGDLKPSVVDSVKVEAPIKVEVSMKVEVSVKVEASVEFEASCVNSDVWKLRDNEVDTTHFFSTRDTWKDKDELLGWVRRQANKAGFTVIIRRSCEGRNAMLELVCERSSEHKVPNRKVKHEVTGSRKCGFCSRCVDLSSRNAMLGNWLFLMAFTTMR